MISYILGLIYDTAKRQRSVYLIAVKAGTFFGISLITYLGYRYEAELISPSLACSAVELFTPPAGMIKVKKIAGGQLLSAFIGVTMHHFLGSTWWSISISVVTAIILMELTDTMHLPGVATAFIAVISNQNYSFIYKPIMLGLGILILAALVIHVMVSVTNTGQSDRINSSGNL